VKRTILYLDDETACVEVFQEMFGDDFDIRTATTPTQARRALNERAADIVISDQRMPDIEGTQFLREVWELYPSSYRVMLTGSATIGDIVREVSLGVVNLLVSKPWTERSMRQILERACASFELRHHACQARAAHLGEIIVASTA
jgi:DNA-binding NtrC family response regulator